MEIKFEKTCNCSPEQYDAYIGDMRVGYIRCRWGQVTVECPSVGGELVYKAITEGYGMFTDDEREFHLNAAREAIELWNKRETARYHAKEEVVATLDLASQVIHEAIYTLGVEDKALENLADVLDKFVRANL